MCIRHMPKNLEILNFEQLLKHVLRVFPCLGGGGGKLVRRLWFSALHIECA